MNKFKAPKSPTIVELTDDELNVVSGGRNAVDIFLISEKPNESVLIGLLLPAVQQVRD